MANFITHVYFFCHDRSICTSCILLLSYRKGEDHKVPDFLSRFRAPIIAGIIDVPEMYLEDIFRKQQRDKEIRNIKRSIEKGEAIHSQHFYDRKNDLAISKGLVMMKEKDKMLPIIPYNDIDEFLTKTDI